MDHGQHLLQALFQGEDQALRCEWDRARASLLCNFGKQVIASLEHLHSSCLPLSVWDLRGGCEERGLLSSSAGTVGARWLPWAEKGNSRSQTVQPWNWGRDGRDLKAGYRWDWWSEKEVLMSCKTWPRYMRFASVRLFTCIFVRNMQKPCHAVMTCLLVWFVMTVCYIYHSRGFESTFSQAEQSKKSP